jgi:hypothetical protein
VAAKDSCFPALVSNMCSYVGSSSNFEFDKFYVAKSEFFKHLSLTIVVFKNDAFHQMHWMNSFSLKARLLNSSLIDSLKKYIREYTK